MKHDLVVAITQHHCACLLKYYVRPPWTPSFVKSRTLHLLQTHFLLFQQQIFFVLVCVHLENARVRPQVLASGVNRSIAIQKGFHETAFPFLKFQKDLLQ